MPVYRREGDFEVGVRRIGSGTSREVRVSLSYLFARRRWTRTDISASLGMPMSTFDRVCESFGFAWCPPKRYPDGYQGYFAPATLTDDYIDLEWKALRDRLRVQAVLDERTLQRDKEAERRAASVRESEKRARRAEIDKRRLNRAKMTMEQKSARRKAQKREWRERQRLARDAVVAGRLSTSNSSRVRARVFASLEPPMALDHPLLRTCGEGFIEVPVGRSRIDRRAERVEAARAAARAAEERAAEERAAEERAAEERAAEERAAEERAAEERAAEERAAEERAAEEKAAEERAAEVNDIFEHYVNAYDDVCEHDEGPCALWVCDEEGDDMSFLSPQWLTLW
jgi:hypothetical protein